MEKKGANPTVYAKRGGEFYGSVNDRGCALDAVPRDDVGDMQRRLAGGWPGNTSSGLQQSGGARAKHVRVDHRGAYVGVAEQLLHAANFDARLEQVVRESNAASCVP